MIWMLYKKAAQAVVNSVLPSFPEQPTNERQPVTREQLSRIVSCVKQAHNLHPAWLKQQYGDINGYLEKHLSTDDWHYVLESGQADARRKLPLSLG